MDVSLCNATLVQSGKWSEIMLQSCCMTQSDISSSLAMLQVVKRAPFELSALIMQRNMLAAHMLDLQDLPAMVQDERSCKACFQKTTCMAMHKVSSYWQSLVETIAPLAEANMVSELFMHPIQGLGSLPVLACISRDEVLLMGA